MNNLQKILIAAIMMPLCMVAMNDRSSDENELNQSISEEEQEKIHSLARHFYQEQQLRFRNTFNPARQLIGFDYDYWKKWGQGRAEQQEPEQVDLGEMPGINSEYAHRPQTVEFKFEPIVGNGPARELSPAMQVLYGRIKDLPTDTRLEALRTFKSDMTVEEAKALADYYVDLANKHNAEQEKN